MFSSSRIDFQSSEKRNSDNNNNKKKRKKIKTVESFLKNKKSEILNIFLTGRYLFRKKSVNVQKNEVLTLCNKYYAEHFFSTRHEFPKVVALSKIDSDLAFFAFDFSIKKKVLEKAIGRRIFRRLTSRVHGMQKACYNSRSKPNSRLPEVG